ncbi:LacI family DNA-binding transcriptional regulator [Ruania halotolerans]|uniref:LacI family DNA-binding transcriptional regulator n=1 Tax=Ruania halotolerans TaxID=2897773 RepID=UPI001E303C25|nr:LacI family DNA-binding transcriptional regulator [Ruania halotolerans]UFU06006.1 LacI family DNA-binding transcriptional regulator [Ruania halotolerans]
MASVTIQDVARRAGVSAATVSNYFNWPDRLSDRMRLQVQRAVDELGFVPNMPARQLRRSRSNTIGLSVINASNPFFADIVVAVEKAAAARGLSVMVGSTHESPHQQDAYLRMFEQFRFDGIILSPFDAGVQHAQQIASRGTPVVLVDHRDETQTLSSASTDHVLGGQFAARHLLEVGCRRLVFASGPPGVRQVEERLRGAQQVVDATDGVTLTVLDGPDLDIDVGRATGRRIAAMSASNRPDGVFAGNDMAAIGIMQGLIGAGLTVPGDVAVLGYDDIAFAETTSVPLSSVRQVSRDIGAAAAELLLGELDVPGRPREQLVFQPQLMARASTARTG